MPGCGDPQGTRSLSILCNKVLFVNNLKSRTSLCKVTIPPNSQIVVYHKEKKERCIITIISHVYVYTACMYDVCMQHTCLVPVELESQRLWATM